MAEETTITEAKTETQQAEKPVAKYTDEDMNNLVTKAKAEATAALLKEHGLESTGKLKDDLKALKAFRESSQTEAEKLAASAKEANDKLSASEARAMAAELKAEALAAGVDPKKLDRALKLAASSDGESPADKVASLLKDFPEFKVASAGGQDFGGKSKDQGGDKSAAAADQLRAAMGMRKKA